MPETEGLRKHGLPSSDHKADVPEHAGSGAARLSDTTASGPGVNAAPGTTMGAAPASPMGKPTVTKGAQEHADKLRA